MSATLAVLTLVSVVTSTLADVSSSSVAPAVEDLSSFEEVVIPVVVTGSTLEHSLEDTPVAIEVLTRKQIGESGARTAADVLSTERGIDVTQTFRGRGAGIRIHGLDPKHVLVLVDGERVVGRIDGSIDLSRIPAERIERLEIVKGACSALYGSEAMGGTIQVITRKPFEPIEGDLLLRYGSLDALDLTAHAATKRSAFDADIVAGFHERDAFDLAPEDVATNGSAYGHTELGARLGFPFQGGSEVVARFDYSHRTTEGIDANPATGAVFDRNSSTRSMDGSIVAIVPLETKTKLRTSIAGNWFFDQFRLDQRAVEDPNPVDETTDLQGVARAQLDFPIGETQVASLGAEGLIEVVESGDRIGGKQSRRRLALFLQDEWAPLDSPKLVLVPGARFDLDSQFGFHPSPKVALRFDPTDRVVLRAGFGLGFRAPDFKELYLAFANQAAGYYVAGNTELEPETSASLSLGLEWSPKRKTRLSVDVFRNDLSNLIETVSASPDRCPAGFGLCFIYDNIAEARTQGLEVGAEVEVVRGLSARLGYSATDTLDERLDRPLEGRAAHRVTFGLSFALVDLGLSGMARGTWVGPRPFYTDSAGNPLPTGSVDAPPYSTLDIRLAQKLFDYFELSVGLENAFDAGTIGYLAIPPRAFWAGLEARYPE
ncbi:MAG: TonB-dependent receptor [Deltaproteobacteria bacterium]|nr:TonB-dependent receptor [Deltaproteobacteria bacterium]